MPVCLEKILRAGSWGGGGGAMSLAGNDLCISYCTSQFSFEIKLAVAFTELLDNIIYDPFAFTVVFVKISTPYITLGVVEMRSESSK